MIRRFLARFRRPPMSRDWCAVCHVDLRHGSIWEVRTDEMTFADGGGAYMAATYCRKHASVDAVRC